MFSGYYICKIMVVTACFLIQTSPSLGDYKLQDPGRKIWSGKLPQWLSYTINFTNVSLACLQLGYKTTNFFSVIVLNAVVCLNHCLG